MKWSFSDKQEITQNVSIIVGAYIESIPLVISH